MKRFSYRDRDYALGQAMLTLRSAVGLTQSGLAEYLGVSRRAVGEWEAGGSYPKAENLKQFIALAIEHQVFPTGREMEEIRQLWQAARQKVLLDEGWPRCSRPTPPNRAPRHPFRPLRLLVAEQSLPSLPRLLPTLPVAC